MRYAARLTVAVDVEVHACGPGDAAQAAKVAGVALRTLIDGSVLPCPGPPVAWVESIDIGTPTWVEVPA